MALIPCEECSKEISDKATFCPNCGYQGEEERKKCFNILLFAAIFLIFALIGLFLAFLHCKKDSYQKEQQEKLSAKGSSILFNFLNVGYSALSG
ncbi:zinc-ribbon domain-containing protein [Candidatus Riflebacteria bacterium]